MIRVLLLTGLEAFSLVIFCNINFGLCAFLLLQTVARISNKGDVICAVQKERKKNFEREGKLNIKEVT
jgi:hypothetical protein